MIILAELAYSVVETAKLLGCSKNTIYAMVEQKRIPHIWLTEHRVVIPKAALEKWLDASFNNVSQAPPQISAPVRPIHSRPQSFGQTQHPPLKPGCGGRRRKEAR